MLKIYDEEEWATEGAGLRYMKNRIGQMMKRNRQTRGMFKTCDEPETPSQQACSRCMMNQIRETGGLKTRDEPESLSEGACLRYMRNRNGRMGGRV